MTATIIPFPKEKRPNDFAYRLIQGVARSLRERGYAGITDADAEEAYREFVALRDSRPSVR